jgi:hypothetical protein
VHQTLFGTVGFISTTNITSLAIQNLFHLLERYLIAKNLELAVV